MIGWQLFFLPLFLACAAKEEATVEVISEVAEPEDFVEEEEEELEDKDRELSAEISQAAAANYKKFVEHFSSKAGRPEGVYKAAVDCPIYSEADGDIVGRLQVGDYVHVLSESEGWTKIGYKRYVKSENIYSLGLRTKGLEFLEGSGDE